MERVRVKRVQAPDLLHLRRELLRPHQELKFSQYAGDEAPTTFHLGAFAEVGTEPSAPALIGIASFYREDFPEIPSQMGYRLRSMATRPEFRRMGVGRRLILEGLKELVGRRCDLLWFNAREAAFPFYLSLGFEFFGESFELPGIGPHRVMFSTNTKLPKEE